MANVCVFGLGFVGLPLALSFAMRGCRVIGVDIDRRLIEDLNRWITHRLESYGDRGIQEILQDEQATGRFRGTLDCMEAVSECESIIFSVGVPV